MSFEQHRTNLVEWFYFEDMITGMERDASVLVLGDKEYVQPLLDMLTERVHTVSRRLDDGSYDYIVIPRLTRRVLKMFQDNLGAMFATLTETWLKKGGSILVGMENALEIDRLAAGTTDPETIYIRYSKVKELREKLHALHPDMKDRMYYPMPALELPMTIYSEDRLPNPEEVDEKTALLLREGEFQQFAPGYLYIFQPDGTHRSKAKDYHRMTPVYMKYNSSRKPEYAIKTEIVCDEKNTLHVVKEGITKEANAHIQALSDHQRLLADLNPNVSVLKADQSSSAFGTLQPLSFQMYPYLTGQSLSEILADMIKDGAAPIKEIKESVDMVIGRTEGSINPANLDCLFDNIIMEKGAPVLIDCEWVKQEDVPVRFLQYRILRYWYLENQGELNYPDMTAFLEKFGFQRSELKSLEDEEEAFQREIHGEGEQSNAYQYEKSRLTLKNYQALQRELANLKASAEELQSQVKERDITVHKYQEIDRLTQVHVSNLTHVIEVHERDIANLQQELSYYKAHQSMASRFHQWFMLHYDAHFPKGSRKRKVMRYIKNTFRHPGKTLPMYFTVKGRNLLHGDFNIGDQYLEYGRLSFPVAEQPVVSIVIPCYNQIAYTYQCLHSILTHTDFEKTPYEVIIADDVSTDATKELKLYTENLVIARNTENMGFLKNCNQAAAIAKGQYILFLNNDTTVSDGWLSSLVDTIEGDETIGMVGSKLVYPDGRLQEAGGIIWSDGSGWNYGRLEDPADPEYNYVKDVDFISGAAIMIRMSLWKEIGGFDERFAPAYYEDTDLAFEVRKHGKRVVFQPKSVVTHFEGISNGTDVNGTGLKHYQLVNQEKFKEKWAEELKAQYTNDGNPNPFRARERGQGKKYILFIEHYVATWDKDAGSKLDYQYIKLFLEKGYVVKYLGDNFEHEEPYTSALEQLGVEVLYGPKLQAGIWDWIEKNKSMIDIAYLNRPHIAAKYIDFLREHTDIRLIFFGCDLHSLRLHREYEVDHDPKTLEEAEYWHNVEFSVMRKTDMNYYPSVAEEEVIRREDPSIPVKAITAFIYEDKVKVMDNYEDREGLLFVGGFGHPPNKDGVLWFVEDILPKVHAALPGVKFRIAGSHVPTDIEALSGNENIEVLGFVSDEKLAELYQSSRLVVAPLRFGAGIKGKIVDAMHNGAAIVTTPVGAEGITDGEHVLRIASDADSFAEAVIELYQSPEKLRAMSQAAVECISRYYTAEGAWDIIKDDFS
jgi:GT2 family glycosyltransferase